MVSSSIYCYHVSLNSNDTIYKTNLNLLCIQNWSLLDMKLKEFSDRTFWPFSIFNLLWIQSVSLHSVIDRNSVCIFVMFTIFHISVSKHSSRSKISCSETHTLFIAETNDCKVSLWCESFIFQLSCSLDRTYNSCDSVKVSTVYY